MCTFIDLSWRHTAGYTACFPRAQKPLSSISVCCEKGACRCDSINGTLGGNGIIAATHILLMSNVQLDTMQLQLNCLYNLFLCCN